MSPKPRLLLVEDEPIQRAVATKVLTAAGWQVDEAPDGAAALCAIASTRYALVLLDIAMPGIDGFDTARAIRDAASGDPTVPILAFTSLPPREIVEQAGAIGMDGHIAKPISAAALVKRVAPWWPQGRTPTQERLAAAFGPTEIRALNESFRGQLADALACIDDPDVAALAHRIAGVAGTLGFVEVHKAWLILSENRRGARDKAADAARRALRMLAVE